MKSNLSFETAYGLFRRLPEYSRTDLDALGVSPTDLKLVASSTPWKRDDVDKVMRIHNTLLFGTCEILRIPKITIPAEYVAPLIASLDAPANQMLACIWLAQERQTGVGALELAERVPTTQQLGPASAEQLFALVCLIMSTDGTERYRERYAAAMGYELEKLLEEEGGMPQDAPTKRRG